MHIKARTVYLLMLITVGVLIYFPLRDVWNLFPQGDLGRDLYVYERILLGELPFRDYYWPYGPLMPCYYAAFFKFFGISVPSLILGKITLNIMSGLIIYRILKAYVGPLIATLACIWFWTFYPGFGHTFNHEGGVFCIMLSLMFLLQYVNKGKLKALYCLFLSLSGILLIKFNMGLAFLASTVFILVISRFSHRENVLIFRKFELKEWFSPLICLFVVGLTYTCLLYGIPKYQISQFFPITPSYDPLRASFSQSLAALFRGFLANFVRAPGEGILSFFGEYAYRTIVAMPLFALLSLIVRENREAFFKIIGVFFIILIFLVTASHEVLLSSAIYRLTWAFPVAVILIYFLLGISFRGAPLMVKLFVSCLILLPIAMQIQGNFAFRAALERSPDQFLDLAKIRIYTQNPPEWKDVVGETVDYMRPRISGKQPLFALPYDPIFYYLLGISSPVPELILFDHINISKEQEAKIIKTLEEKKVPYVLISNRAYSLEKGLGIFGRTYCPALAEYIRSNFALEKSIGDWCYPGGWVWPYATRIYKRIAK